MKIKKQRLKLHLIEGNAQIHTFTIKIYTPKGKYIKLDKQIKEEFIRSKKEHKSQRNEYDRHIEHLQLTEVQINARAFYKSKSAEECFIENEGENYILREIWNLPTPQNRRVYMYIVNEFSLTKISKIEKRTISTVKQSIDVGLEKLRKKLKKF